MGEARRRSSRGFRRGRRRVHPDRRRGQPSARIGRIPFGSCSMAARARIEDGVLRLDLLDGEAGQFHMSAYRATIRRTLRPASDQDRRMGTLEGLGLAYRPLELEGAIVESNGSVSVHIRRMISQASAKSRTLRLARPEAPRRARNSESTGLSPPTRLPSTRSDVESTAGDDVHGGRHLRRTVSASGGDRWSR